MTDSESRTVTRAQLAAALEAMWPHHTEGVGSVPPSPTDHTYEVWEPFLPGSPNSIADAIFARLPAGVGGDREALREALVHVVTRRHEYTDSCDACQNVQRLVGAALADVP